MVQLSTVLSCIWLCVLADSQFVSGYGQRVGLGPYYGLGYGYFQGQGYVHRNLPGYGYNHQQTKSYGHLQGQPYANAQPYGTLPGQRSHYPKFRRYPKQPIDGGFKTQIAELPPTQGHTQQQQRMSWQNQIYQLVKAEEKLKQKSVLGSGNTRSEEGNERAEPAVGKIVETFEIIDLHGLKNEKVESIEKPDCSKRNLEVMNNKQKKDVQEDIQEVKSMLQPDSSDQKSSYIEEAEIFLRKFNEKQKIKDIVPAYSESLKENNIADKSTQKDNKSVVDTKSDVHEKVKPDKLEQSQIKDILIENIKSKEGLKEIIKKLLKGKLESKGLLGF